MTATPPTTPPPAPPDLATVPGLDVRAGLESVGGRMASYRRLLDLFLNTHGGDIDRIRQQLTSGSREEGQRLAHSLKGASGTLGAREVYVRAAALETAIKTGAPTSATEDSLAALEAALSPLVAALAAATMPPAQPGGANFDPGRARPLVERLNSLLAENDMQAISLWRDSQAELTNCLGQKIAQRLEQLIQQFDFEEASQLLEKAAADLPDRQAPPAAP